MSTPTPRLLGGRYELGELIGRGGMAEVHEGYDARLGRPVAVKILRSDHARDASFLHRFRREAQSVAGLNHRSIVAVYDSGEDTVTESGGAQVAIPYIVMELVEGRTLREVLNDEGSLPPEEAARVTEGVLDALAYSHRMGIIHRDIKPGNVMIGEDGAVKVMDFGIARAVADAQATMTQTAAVIGTAQYISPEQARGETVDNRSDIYSTGCLLFELLTGRTPYTGEPISLTYQHVNAEIPLPSSLVPDLPRDLDAIVAHALTKDRDERYTDAADMAEDLRAYRAGAPVSPAATATLAAAGAAGVAGLGGDPTVVYARPAQPVGETSTWVPAGDPDTSSYPPATEERRRRGGLGWLLALLLLIPLLALGWYAWTANQEPEVQTVAVPTLVGLDESTAKATLEEAGLLGEATVEESEQPEGEVLSQDPTAGRRVEARSVVEYTVSGGVGQTQVPKLVGLTRADAEEAIRAAGLSVGEVDTADSPEQDKNHVVSSTPGELEQVAKGTEVGLVVSSGNVPLEDYRGRNISEVRFILHELGLEISETPVESDQPEGEILAQSPGAGTVARGSTVTLTVAKAPTQTVTETSEPTTTTETTTTTEPTTTTTEPTTTEPTTRTTTATTDPGSPTNPTTPASPPSPDTRQTTPPAP